MLRMKFYLRSEICIPKFWIYMEYQTNFSRLDILYDFCKTIGWGIKGDSWFNFRRSQKRNAFTNLSCICVRRVWRFFNLLWPEYCHFFFIILNRHRLILHRINFCLQYCRTSVLRLLRDHFSIDCWSLKLDIILLGAWKFSLCF